MALASKKKKIFDGRYEIISIVGRGSESVVYHARHAMTPSLEVALKVLLADKSKDSLSVRLRREALTLVSCRHKYVVRLDDFHAVADLCYLSMEFAPEGDLRKYIQKLGKKLPVAQAQAFLEQSAEALDFIHKTGITHRDIKPDNILVINDEEVRIADFGIALLPGEEAPPEELSSGVGSFSYMPPEVLEGKSYDQLSDQYSLALSFYEMITGLHPFEKAPLARQLEVRQEGGFAHISTLVPEIPEAFARILMKGLSYNPADRFPTAGAMLDALRGKESAPAPAKTPAPAFDKHYTGSEADRAVSYSQAARASAEALPTPNPFAEPPYNPFPYAEEEALPFEDAISNEPYVGPPLDDTSPYGSPYAESTQEDPYFAPSDPYAPIAEPEPFDPEATTALSPFDQQKWQESLAAKRSALAEELDEDEDDLTEEDTFSGTIPAARGEGIGDKFRGFLTHPNFKKRVVAIGAFVAVITFIVPPLLSVIFGGGNTRTVETPSTDETIEVARDADRAPQFLLPEFEAESFDLASLPPGVYNGAIRGGIIPNEAASLTLVSLGPDADGKPIVAVLIGMEGWTPTIATPADSPDAPYQLRVSSNGFVLDLSGTVTEGAISGQVLNKVSQETGVWGVRPQAKG